MNILCEITAEDGSLGIQTWHGAWLREAIGAYPTLEIDAAFRDSRQRLLNAVGASVRFRVQHGSADLHLFEGIVRTVRYRSHRTRLVCVTPAAKWDLIPQTRSFAALDGAPVALHSLPGFQAAFPGIQGLNRLTAQVTDITQFDESDWTFLRRLGARFGLSLLVRGGQVEMASVATGETVNLADADLIPDDEEVTLRAGIAGVQSRAWQYPLGHAPAAAGQKGRQARGLAVEDRAGQQGEQLAGVTEGQVFLAALAPGWSNADEAGRRVRLQQGQLVRWSGSLFRLELGLGQRIRLPDPHDLGGPLIILRRCLTYSPHDPNYQLSNHIEAAAELLDLEPPLVSAGPRLAPGVVLAVQDSARLGRVRVRFPWEADNEGLWCLVPQPFGGSGHGAVHLPSPHDWVAVSFQPEGLMPPVILGAIYHSGAQAPGKIGDPAKQRLLAQTTSGHHILLDDAKGELTVAVQPDDEPVCSVVLAKEPAAVTVSVPGGKVVLLAGNSKLTLGDNALRAEADTIDLTGKSAIKLTAAQVEVKASGGVSVSSRLSVKS